MTASIFSSTSKCSQTSSKIFTGQRASHSVCLEIYSSLISISRFSMGSLVGGWDSGKLARGLEPSRSFTKDEIDVFWKSRRQQQVQELHQPEAATSPRTQALKIMEEDNLSAEEKKKLANNWWRRSNSAFLNARPDEDIKGGKYTPVFDSAKRAQAGSDMGVATS